MKAFALFILKAVIILAVIALAIVMINEGGMSEKLAQRSIGASIIGWMLCGRKNEETTT